MTTPDPYRQWPYAQVPMQQMQQHPSAPQVPQIPAQAHPSYPNQPVPGQPYAPYAQPVQTVPIPVAGLNPVVPGQVPQAYAVQQPVVPNQPMGVQQPAGPSQPYAFPQPVFPNRPAVPNQPVALQYSTAPNQPYGVQQPFVPNQPFSSGGVAATPAQFVTSQPTWRPQPANRPIPVAPGTSPAGTAPVNRPVPMGGKQPGAARPVPVTATPGAIRTEANPDEEEQQDEAAAKAVRAAPPWLISMVVHMVFLLILALLYLPQLLKPRIDLEVVYAEEIGEQLIDDTMQMAQLEPLDISEPVLSNDINPVDNPLAAPPDIPQVTFDATTATSDIVAPSIGLALSGREKGMKQALLAAYGGTAGTEAAVQRGLEWLKRNQQKDGLWSLAGPYANGSLGAENRAAATAMALLAFQGAGHTHQTGEFKDVVAKAWDALLKMQDADGNFFHEGTHHHRLYTQAQCTIALCEIYGMTKDSRFRDAAQRAIDYAIKSQSAAGGWRYTPNQDSDTSVTGWFVMALQSARMAGLQVPSPGLDNISKFLDSVTRDGIHYGYQPGHGSTVPMTAEALLCRQYLGWKHDDERLAQGVNFLNANPIDYSSMDVYSWYYATQVTHHMEGEYWNKWNQVMRRAVPDAQIKTGKESGSWSPTNDRWGTQGGRLYTTCLSIYMLEVYYRHLPIYKYQVQ